LSFRWKIPFLLFLATSVWAQESEFGRLIHQFSADTGVYSFTGPEPKLSVRDIDSKKLLIEIPVNHSAVRALGRRSHITADLTLRISPDPDWQPLQPSSGPLLAVWDGADLVLLQSDLQWERVSSERLGPKIRPEQVTLLSIQSDSPAESGLTSSNKYTSSLWLFTLESKIVFRFETGRLGVPWKYLLPAPHNRNNGASLVFEQGRVLFRRAEPHLSHSLLQNHASETFPSSLKNAQGRSFCMSAPIRAFEGQGYPSAVASSYRKFPEGITPYLEEQKKRAKGEEGSGPAENAGVGKAPGVLGTPKVDLPQAAMGDATLLPWENELASLITKELLAERSVLLVDGPDSGVREAIDSIGDPAKGWLKGNERSLSYLTAVEMGAGKYRGDFHTLIEEKILKPARKKDAPVFVIADAHSFVGLGRAEGQPNDFYDYLGGYIEASSGKKPPLFIFVVSPEQYSSLPPDFFARHVRKIKLSEGVSKTFSTAQLSEEIKRRFGYSISAEELERMKPWLEAHSPGESYARALLRTLEFRDSERETPLLEENAPTTFASLKSLLQDALQVPSSRWSGESAIESFRRLQGVLDHRLIGKPDMRERLVRLRKEQLFVVVQSKKPSGRILLLGPSGVDGSEVAHAYSFGIYGKPAFLIDMNQFSRGGTKEVEQFKKEVASAIIENRERVLLLAHPESAHPDIQLTLSETMASSVFVYKSGFSSASRSVYLPTQYSTWFLTSNVADHLFDNPESTVELDESALRRHLTQGMPGTADEGKALPRQLLAQVAEIWPVYGPRTEAELIVILKAHLMELFAEQSGPMSPFPRQIVVSGLDRSLKQWVERNSYFEKGKSPHAAIEALLAKARKSIAEANFSDLKDGNPLDVCVFELLFSENEDL
jgi:hypothetical protein